MTVGQRSVQQIVDLHIRVQLPAVTPCLRDREAYGATPLRQCASNAPVVRIYPQTGFYERIWNKMSRCVFYWIYQGIYSTINCTDNSIVKPESRRTGMLLNNIELDVKTKCIEEKISQQKVGEEVGTSGAYVSRLINHPEKIVNKTFLAMMEKLGYDVRLTYEKREIK